ncbi:TonB-dependent receptor [Bacteroidales bacterium OttesenSCG-928-A17]|nr:TonB-dependent receptor [Bacteroidales bacterium OttesenSCG-928-A17]
MRVFRPLILSLLLIVGCGASSLSAQNRVVSGKVLDTDQEPMIGVVVLVDGTTNGGVTAADGSFKIEAPSKEIVLSVSYLGYIPQKVTVPLSKNDVTIFMQENVIQLEEAVVLGYGTQKRVNLTGAVSVVGAKDLENRTAHSVTHMLQGSVPGLNVTTSSGKPGSSAAINVRGVTSINGADPLVLVDGAVGDLNRVNPNDVESISVIKDGSAAAVYGARAAFGVILVTTKSGGGNDGKKATIRYSGRFGWEEPTTSTDYENRGYWSVYLVNKFWQADNSAPYYKVTERDMQQLLARVNDKTEHPDRPWVVEEERNGRKQWLYYGNYDWWDMLYRQQRPVQQHNVSITGGTGDIKYLVSGAYDRQEGMQKQKPDLYQKYNLRSKVDFRINEWATFSNNTSFYSSKYESLGPGSIDNTIGYSARHALANIPMKNPDGSWVYGTPYTSYKVANGRHIVLGEESHRNTNNASDFANTARLVISPIKQLKVTGDYTYRLYQTRNTNRQNPMYFRQYPDGPLEAYETGAGQNQLDESVNTRHYHAFNVYANYEETFNEVHHVAATVGLNQERFIAKNISAWGQDLSSADLDDLNLVGQNDAGNTITGVGGGQYEYTLLGYFARVNYDYKGRYLAEVSARRDGTSRFADGHRWGTFPSGSIGWRISEESFFEPARKAVDNLKVRASFGSLGNQNISEYYTYARLISINDFAGYSFGEGSTMGKYSTLGAPIASDRTWETAEQWNLGLDATFLSNRLNFIGDVYIRDTKNMLAEGVALPAVYGASSPLMNVADLRTKGFELAINWRDHFQVAGKPLEYSVGFNLSDYQSTITKYDNPERSFAKKYYEGMKLGEIWGYTTGGLFQSTEEAQAYEKEVNLKKLVTSRLGSGWQAGDLKFLDIDGDEEVSSGQNTVDDPGDLRVLGNSLPSLSYGITASARWNGIDISAFFQGTGNHHYYPHGQMMGFWGPYSYPYLSFMPKNFTEKIWSEDNRDAYFTRPMCYSASGGPMSKVNDRYLQNLRYLRFKNLTVGYTLPAQFTKKAKIDQVRVYFSGENLCYWSPLKKNSEYVDPEAVIDRSNVVYQNAFYPWPKSFMFGIDITF